MVLVAYAGPVRPAAALRNSVLCLPTDIHSLLVNNPPPPPPPPPPAAAARRARRDLILRSGFESRVSIGPAGSCINRNYANRGWAAERV